MPLKDLVIKTSEFGGKGITVPSADVIKDGWTWMRAIVDILSVCAHVGWAGHIPSGEKSKTGFQERKQLENMRVGSAH